MQRIVLAWLSTRGARRIETVSSVECAMVITTVLAAVAMARGLG
jgi:hypothetical protein